MSYSNEYTQAVLRINAMREQLRKDPSNKDLARKIQQEEEKLYEKEISQADEELSRFLRLKGIETSEDDDY